MGDVTAIAQYTPPAALAKPLEWTPEQRKMIRDTYANGASESEFSMLMQIASLRRLDPILRQIWFVQRWDSNKKCMVWAPQTSIDGFRTIAQRTGLYDGQDEPEFGKDEEGKFCKVKVYRKDWSRPSVGKAYFTEYAAKKKDGSLTAMWSEKPHVMLAKCAEALAIRKAFPEDTAGLYVPEEMGEKDVTPPAAQPSQASRARAEKVLAKAHGETVDVSQNAEAALMVAIGNAATVDALKALVPHFKGMAPDALDRLRAAYGERQRALKAAAAAPPEPRKSAEEIAAEERELAEYAEEVDARNADDEVLP